MLKIDSAFNLTKKTSPNFGLKKWSKKWIQSVYKVWKHIHRILTSDQPEKKCFLQGNSNPIADPWDERYIYQLIYHNKSAIHVGKYTSPMDP